MPRRKTQKRVRKNRGAQTASITGNFLGIKPIKVSEVRVPAAAQRKFRKAWGDHLSAELELEKIGYPLINIKNNIPWVCDGQHRIYALKENGFGNDVQDCEVYKDMTEQQMAELFLGRNDNKPVATFDKFQVACTAQRERELEIYRVVEENGLRISRDGDDGCISSVGTLGRIYDRFGTEVLGQTLASIKNGYAGDPAAFDRMVLQGVALVFNRYSGRVTVDDLAAAFSESHHGVRGLLRRAQAQRDRTGNTLAQCCASAIVDLYNKACAPRSKKRLPLWWKGV